LEPRIIGGIDERLRGVEAAGERELFLSGGGGRAERGGVRSPDIVDNTEAWLDHLGELAHLARLAYASLDDGELMIATQLEQREGDADL
jgi:hypothetical protein